MGRLLLISCYLLAAFGCRPRLPVESVGKDAGIVTTAPEHQRSTAFCWAYALAGHLEQRLYERTRGVSQGGIRLNLSEEYLGLIQMADQLMKGKPSNEGAKLSDALALVEKYGIVPEKVGQRTLFRAKFEFSLTDALIEKANTYWQTHDAPENTPIPEDDVFRMIAELADPNTPDLKLLTIEQVSFLKAALHPENQSGARFAFGHSTTHANPTYTPLTFAINYLKFAAGDYYTLTFPDSGRGRDGTLPFDPNYVRVLKLLKKALLYGYSVPFTFNIVRGAKFENGAMTCTQPGCWDAKLASPTPTWPHANHAVLLIDHRTAESGFQPINVASLERSFNSPPVEWVIKNSWGFNANTSTDPDLLRRFPLPAYTKISQDFFEASHRLLPGKFEALLPRKVCLRDSTPARNIVCEDLITAHEAGGVPAEAEAELTLNSGLIVENQNRASVSRYPVEFNGAAPDLPDGNSVANIVEPETDLAANGLAQANLSRQTVVAGISDQTFNLCGKAVVGDQVKYLAVFYAEHEGDVPDPTPKAVVSPQSSWRYCVQIGNREQTFALYLQPLDGEYKALGKIKAVVKVNP